MANVIIIIILAVIIINAVVSAFKHFKGEGGCCGGGGEIKAKRKKLDGKIIARKTVRIEGMHCQHCKNSVENSINNIEGATAVVNLKKNVAVVSVDRDVSDEDIRAAVESVGFRCVEIV